MNFRLIARNLGLLLIILALSMSGALAWSLLLHDGDHSALIESMVICALTGLLLYMIGRRGSREFYRREALAIVGLGWILAAVMGSLPFILSGMLKPVDAFFETMSGLTATGSTVITDINGVLTGPDARHGVIFWRSFTHWLGGMGIVVLLLALLPAVGAGTRFLFASEAPGITAESLKPRIRQTALRLWFLYVGLSVVEFILLCLSGMSIYDSMCHTFGTMAGGGFSTQNASIAAFHSLKIEIIIIVFMFLAATNFGLHYQIVHRRWFAWFKDVEWRWYTGILIAVIAVITLDLTLRGPSMYHGEGVGLALRHSAFTVVSISTTTGFCNSDFDVWPALSRVLLILLMIIGGCGGSTAGGLKIVRVLILFKIAGHQLSRIFNPRRVRTVYIGTRALDQDLQTTVLVYFLIVMMIFVGATLLLTVLISTPEGHLDIVTASTAVIATFNNVGPGLGSVGATHTFAGIPAFGKLVLSFCMVVGRLELWAILCLFVPGFWWTHPIRRE